MYMYSRCVFSYIYIYVCMYVCMYTYTYPSNFVNSFENQPKIDPKSIPNRRICVWGKAKHRFCVSNQLVWIRERNYPLSRTKRKPV